MFLGTFVNKIDKKGRVSIPASFRSSPHIGDIKGIVAFCSFRHPCIEVCDWQFFEKLKDQTSQLDLFSQEYDDFMTVVFGEAQALHFDPEGRVILSKDFLTHSGITSEASFIGVGDFFQIWNPDKLISFKNEARNRLKKKNMVLNRSQIFRDNS